MTSSEVKPEQRLLVHATNVHQGGGRTLLDALLKLSLKAGTTALLDARMPLPPAMPATTTVVRVKPSIPGRLLAERRLRLLARPDDVVLCFGNLPPMFDVAGHVVVFIQNRYLIDDVPLTELPVWSRLRIYVERIWLRMRSRTVHEFVVQTPSMKGLLVRYLSTVKTKSELHVRIQPFVGSKSQSFKPTAHCGNEPCASYDFMYVASGEFHKNHHRLIEAWILLAQEGYHPSLVLTIDTAKFADLCDWIKVQKQLHHLRIENKGVLPISQVMDLYKSSGALIYPSTLESFGLPLHEARNAGLPVLAGELDYVRDVLDPDETFDPNSAVSIARAVKRFMCAEEAALKIIDADAFVASLGPNPSKKYGVTGDQIH